MLRIDRVEVDYSFPLNDAQVGRIVTAVSSILRGMVGPNGVTLGKKR